MFTSYAQNFEDVILWRALKQVEHGFYVDIGAQDPIDDSVSRAFYENGWRGLHVEPTATYAAKLRENRPDEEVVEAAIGNSHEQLRFFEIPQSGLSTGDPKVAEMHRASGMKVLETEVPQLTLSTLFDRIGEREIHWLKIDVEGMEDTVIESWKPSKARPWIVVVESTAPNSQVPTFAEWEPHLISLGYEHVYFDGVSRFYVSIEHRQLASSFGPGPNVFDEFRLSPTSGYVDVDTVDARILELRKTLESAAVTNAAALADRDLRIGSLDAERKELQIKMDHMEAERKGIEARLEELDARSQKLQILVDELQKARDELSLELHTVYASRSWRLTEPLRTANTRVARLVALPKNALRLPLEHALCWLRQRPKRRAQLLRVLRLVPALERRFLRFAEARRPPLLQDPSFANPAWSLDPDPKILSEWKKVLGIS